MVIWSVKLYIYNIPCWNPDYIAEDWRVYWDCSLVIGERCTERSQHKFFCIPIQTQISLITRDMAHTLKTCIVWIANSVVFSIYLFKSQRLRVQSLLYSLNKHGSKENQDVMYRRFSMDRQLYCKRKTKTVCSFRNSK